MKPGIKVQMKKSVFLLLSLLFVSLILTSCEEEKEDPPVASFICDKTSGTVPLTVNFTSASTGKITSFSWNFGDGGTSTSQNPSHTYNSAGTYTATLTVNGPGGSNSSTKTITATELPPVASFTCNKTSGPVPLTVNFTSTSTGTITSYSWNFGDGGTSTSQNPSHTYNNAGTYTAMLTVNGPGGSNSASITIIGEDPTTYTDMKFYNKAYTPITITVGSTTKTINEGSSITFYSVEGTSAYYSAYTYGKTDIGSTQIGLRIEWSSTLTLSGGTQSWNLNVSSNYFFIYLRNNSAHNLVHLYVNYGLVSQTYDNIVVYNTNTKDPLGYYKAYTNSNVRMYWQDNTSVFYYWDQGTHFTLPWTINQQAYLLATKSDNTGTDRKSNPAQLCEPGTSIIPAKSNIYKSDPDAKDLYCK